MSESDIFISYSREDRAAARHFSECFAREGFSVWWDAALRSGETFDEVIERELRGAKAVVVLWSPRSVTSRWVRAEATLADRRNKLVPAIIEACDRPRLDAVRGHDHAGGVPHLIDFDEARTVGSDGVQRGRCINVQLQIGAKSR